MKAIDSSNVPAKRRWVDVMSPVNLQFWAQELRCSEWQLLDAVAYVGSRVDDLRRHLASHQARLEPRLD